MAEVQVKARHNVTPAEETWRGTKYLAETDMALQNVFMPMLYFYPPTGGKNHHDLAQKLKASLSMALVHFYPFAGRLRPSGGGRAVLECDERASWVLLLEAEEISGAQVAELGVDLPEAAAAAWVGMNHMSYNKFENLIPVVDQTTKPLHELPLFSAQLTSFRCGGFTLGFRVAHGVADGLGIGHFLTQWARLARGEALEMVPVHDRTLMRAGQPPRAIASAPILDLALPSPPSPTTTIGAGEFTVVNLLLTKLQMDRLKELAGGCSYSNFEVLAAHSWRCFCKAKGPVGEAARSTLTIPVDTRKRVKPALPQAYLGNAIILTPVVCESTRQLISDPLGDACEKIREAVDNVSDEYVWTYIEHLKWQADLLQNLTLTPTGVPLKPDLMLTSWLELPIFELDFGWGKEAHMVCLVPPIGGLGGFMPGKEEGTTIVTFCLEVSQTHKFEEYFYEDLLN